MRIILVLLVMFVLVGCSSQSDVKVKIGVLQFGDYASLNNTLKGIETSFEDEDVTLIVKNAQGESSNIMLMASELVEMEVDAMIAITTQAAQVAVGVSEGKIPVFFVAVSDPVEAGLVVENVTGVSDAAFLDDQFELIKALTPSVKTLGVLHKTGDPNGVYQTQQIIETAKKYNINVSVQGAMEISDLSMLAVNLSEKVDAMYLITDSLIVANTGLIVEAAKEVGVMSYASEDGQMEYGVLATSSISYLDLGRQVSHQVKRVLFEGVDINSIEIEYPELVVPLINGEVAQFFEIEIPESFQSYVK